MNDAMLLSNSCRCNQYVCVCMHVCVYGKGEKFAHVYMSYLFTSVLKEIFFSSSYMIASHWLIYNLSFTILCYQHEQCSSLISFLFLSLLTPT
uniref:Uncharacterized protein n=1 Tax=Octopus bimaculoides TaxID=37653 RepID=A0A0L8IBN9_OCTBM